MPSIRGAIAPPDAAGHDAPHADADFASVLGHRFARPELLQEALTHRSAATVDPGRPGSARARQHQASVAGQRPRAKGAGSNERLEFIGDRVLGLLIAEWLAERFPDEQEGELGRRLAQLVSGPVIAGIAERIGLGAALDVGPGEARAGVKRLSTVLADALEAAIGALYLDGGIAPARALVRRAWNQAMVAQATPPTAHKTALQEWAQARGLPLPAYVVTARDGPSHAPSFVVGVTVAGATATGTGTTKRAAEQEAAGALLALLAP